jgi:hypothetical protein
MRISYLFTLTLIAFSCISDNDALYEIDPRNFVDNKITLAGIADDIKYVPLDSNFPFTPYNYRITPGFIYTSTKNSGILKFDRQGKLINTIGRKGRGPGEFSSGFKFTVDEKSGDVFIMDTGNRTKVYSQNGTFLREIRLSEIVGSERWNSDIEIFNSKIFYPNSIESGNSKYNWLILDTLGNLVATKENSVPSFQNNMGRDAVIYKYGNKLFYYNWYNDTIFSISPDLIYNGEYVFAPGNHRWPKMIINTMKIEEMNSLLHSVFEPIRMSETKHFILLTYGYLDKAAFCLINKENKKTFLAYKNFGTSGNGYRYTTSCLINDIDGGMPLTNIGYYSENNEEYITSLISPFDLKGYVLTDEFKESTPKYSEKKKNVEILANRLKETDNPVLMMVRLKK